MSAHNLIRDKALAKTLLERRRTSERRALARAEELQATPMTNELVQNMVGSMDTYKPGDPRACQIALPSALSKRTGSRDNTRFQRARDVHSQHRPALEKACRAMHHAFHSDMLKGILPPAGTIHSGNRDAIGDGMLQCLQRGGIMEGSRCDFWSRALAAKEAAEMRNTPNIGRYNTTIYRRFLGAK